MSDPPHGGLRPVLCRPVLLRALAVAVVVGTILNVINQGDALLAGAAINWFKVGLTYCAVPCRDLRCALCPADVASSAAIVITLPIDQDGAPPT